MSCKHAKITVVEFNSLSHEHARVNAGYLQVLSEIFNDVDFIAPRTHLNAINEVTEDLKCELSEVKAFKYGYLTHKRQFFSLLWIFFNKFKLSRREKMIFLTVTPLSIMLIKCFGWILAREIYLVLHSELENLDTSKGILRIKYALRMLSLSNVTLILNHKHILKKISRYGIKKQVKVVNLPYYFEAKKKGNRDYGLFLSFGLFSRIKNSQLLLDLARVDSLKKAGIKLGHVGVLDNSIILPDVTDLHICPDDSMLSNEYFAHYLGRCGAILMFPTAKFQYFSVSGIILDAINHSTPIISLRSEVLEVFSKEYPGLIFLVDDLNEMSRLIEKFSQTQFEIDGDKLKLAWQVNMKEDALCVF